MSLGGESSGQNGVRKGVWFGLCFCNMFEGESLGRRRLTGMKRRPFVDVLGAQKS